MAMAVFDPKRVLGDKIAKMDRQELCEFVAALCRQVVSEVGSRGRRGGIYPGNISVDDSGNIAIGPSGQSPWEGEELEFIAPELYWNGQLSAASDVYSIGMLMYYAVTGGKLPLEGECKDAQLRRMGGEDYPAPAAAGRRLGEIIEKCIRFKPAGRYQTLEELRAVLDSCIKNLYLSGVPSAEAIFKKSDDDLSDIERMMVGIIEQNEGMGEELPMEEDPAPLPAAPAAPEKTVEMPANRKSPITPQQSAIISERFKTQARPAVPKLDRQEEPELAPVAPQRLKRKQPNKSGKVSEDVKKRRRRPLALILILCAVLIMVAIVINAMLKDFQQAKDMPDNVTPAPIDATADPYMSSLPPMVNETPDIAGLNIPGVEAAPEAQLETAAPEASPIPTPGGTTLPVEHSYKVFKEDISWTAARQKCEEMGGHLVVISDEEELQEVIALAEANGLSRIWVGGHRVDGYEVWETTEAGYLKWAKGEPSYVDVNDQVSEDYFMLWNNRGWAFNDNRNDPCADYPDFYSGTMGFICEFE